MRGRQSSARCCQTSNAVVADPDRKSTRLNSSHANISYAVFCLKKKEHTSELQSRQYLVCRLLLEKKKKVIGEFHQIKTTHNINTHSVTLSLLRSSIY